MEFLALAASTATGLAVIISVMRHERAQRRTRVYTVAEYRRTFGGGS